jgi:hypothetical protein
MIAISGEEIKALKNVLITLNQDSSAFKNSNRIKVIKIIIISSTP